jgi:hypothetical protein
MQASEIARSIPVTSKGTVATTRLSPRLLLAVIVNTTPLTIIHTPDPSTHKPRVAAPARMPSHRATVELS